MDVDDVFCVECKKNETDSSKVVTCLYCFKSAHLKCRNIIGNAIQRVKKQMYFCSADCSIIYKRIMDMQNNNAAIVTALSAELKTTVANVVSAEMQHFREEVHSITTAIETSQDFLSTKFDAIASDFKDLKSENESLKREVNDLKHSQAYLSGTVDKLESNVDRSNRDALQNNAIFFGFPTLPNENVLDLVHKTAHKIGVNLPDNAITSASRIFSNNKLSNVVIPIRVIFSCNSAKELIFTKKRELGELISTSIEKSLLINGKPTKITIRDELTPLSLELMKEMRESQEFLNIKYVWSGRGGVVLVKKDDKAKPEVIKSRDDLRRITSLYMMQQTAGPSSEKVTPSPKRKRSQK